MMLVAELGGKVPERMQAGGARSVLPALVGARTMKV
jgi:hypothetical protein